jgi:alpha-D-ribose 1-methylphosphonate 5-triphosphate synthase subunit PhnH
MSTPTHSSSLALSTLTPGFTDPVHDTQHVFRILLDTLARPGKIATLGDVLPAARAPAEYACRAELAAFAALLTLCDYTTPVWLAELDTALASALRFHTGAPIVDDAGAAAFAYVHQVSALPPLERFALGDPEAPEHSATLLIRVDALSGGTPVVLRGPGIEHAQTFSPVGLPARFWQQRAELAPLFPCGIDCYFVCGDALVGLPRTTRVELN